MRVPFSYPRGNKRKNIRRNPLAKEMHSIDDAQGRATATPIVSTQPTSPAFALVPPCIFQNEHCRSLVLMDPLTEVYLTP